MGALVEQVGAWLRIVVWDPFPNGRPRRFDGLEGFDVERRVGRWWDVDGAFQKCVEAKEELDFALAEEGVHDFHGAFAARLLERVGTPNAEDEVAPEGCMARAATLGGGGTMGGFASGCFSPTGSVPAAVESGMPRLLFE